MSYTRRNVPKLRFAGRAAGKPRSRWFVLSVGFAVVAIAAVMFTVGYRAPNTIPGRSYYTVYALMHDADNLEDHYDVRIGGQLAGQVLGVQVAHHEARVELQLASNFGPLRQSSTIQIRLRSAVGIRYVEINPGKTGPFIRNGGILAASQTSTPIDLDQVLDIFNAPTRAGTQNFVGELGQGLAGQGTAVNTTIHDAPGMLKELDGVSAAVNANINSLHNLISGADGTAIAVAPVAQTMADGFSTDSRAAKPFVVQRRGLDQTLDQAPATLSTASDDLPSVRALVAQVQGLAQAAKPTLLNAPGALRATTAMLAAARPGLRNANTTLQLAQKAVTPTLTFLETAQPVLPQIDDAAADLLPTVDYVAPRACGLSTAMTGWSEMMKWGTAYDNFIRFTADETGPIAGSTIAAPLTSPYPGPCTAAGNESGQLLQTPEQQVANP